jgi:ATP/maltotriose-dependent transcriptional regulator MalT
MSEPTFDPVAAHRHFAMTCFNRAWDYLELPRRDDRQVEEMLHVAHASFWHWLQVPERTPANLSIGLWQLARVYAVAGRAADARRWAERCLELGESAGLESFYVAYAHEAAARADRVAGDGESAARHLAAARALLPSIDDVEDRDRLARDLDALDRG